MLMAAMLLHSGIGLPASDVHEATNVLDARQADLERPPAKQLIKEDFGVGFLKKVNTPAEKQAFMQELGFYHTARNSKQKNEVAMLRRKFYHERCKSVWGILRKAEWNIRNPPENMRWLKKSVANFQDKQGVKESDPLQEIWNFGGPALKKAYFKAKSTFKGNEKFKNRKDPQALVAKRQAPFALVFAGANRLLASFPLTSPYVCRGPSMPPEADKTSRGKFMTRLKRTHNLDTNTAQGGSDAKWLEKGGQSVWK